MTTVSKKAWSTGLVKVVPACAHPSLVPLEFSFGKVTFDRTPGNFQKLVVWDEWNIVACHRARVVRYYCPACKDIIKVSTNYNGKEQE